MIYIFGDSYGDPRQSPHDDVVANTDCWYSLLTKHEKVNNYCIGAIGPIDHFKLFWKNHNDICNDEHAKIFFLLSNPFRLNFDFLEEQSHAKEFGEFALIGNSLYRYFFQYKKQTKSFYNFMSDELYHLNYKNIMTLKCISMLHNVKIIVFVCFTVDLNTVTLESCKNDEYIFKLTELNDDQFKLYSNTLSAYGRDYGNTPVKCKNHFHKEDHEIMYNIIANYFYGGKRSEIFEPRTDNEFRYIYQ